MPHMRSEQCSERTWKMRTHLNVSATQFAVCKTRTTRVSVIRINEPYISVLTPQMLLIGHYWMQRADNVISFSDLFAAYDNASVDRSYFALAARLFPLGEWWLAVLQNPLDFLRAFRIPDRSPNIVLKIRR